MDKIVVNESICCKVIAVIVSWTVGEVKISRILEFESRAAPESLYPGMRPELVNPHRHWLEPVHLDPANGMLITSHQSFLIQTNSHVLLVDTSTGNDKTRPQKPWYHMKNWPFIENLAAIGYQPDDIDVVLFTHMHLDHVGCNTRLVNNCWVPTFPKARYLFVREEWDHWRIRELRDRYTTDPFFEDSILPVIDSDLVDFVAIDHVVNDQVALVPSPGHTPGHVCVHVRSAGAEAVIGGDIAHTALQYAQPEFNSCFCIDGELARRTRRNFLETYAERPVLIINSHFPTAGWIRRQGDAFKFDSLS